MRPFSSKSTSRSAGAGIVTSRVFANGKTQTLTWDGLGRLVSLTQRDASTNGFNWTALYDGLGRRLRTIHTPVGTNVVYAAQTLVTDSFYDPQVEFLEVAVSLNGQRTWKVIGPDINGVYGSMQGVGGLEATIRETDGLTTPVINDHFGNVVATVSGTNANWNPVRVGGYGPVNGYQVEALTPSVPLAETLVWRSRRIDPSGFYYLGARYYDPLAARFLSPDPLGHTASMSLYDFCSGDPLNSFDPDGRLSARSTQSGIENAPPPYELGIAPEMRSYVDVFHENPDGTLTSGDVLRGAGEDDPKQFWRVTEPTGNIFSYVRDTRLGGPLADPDYGHYRREEITGEVYFQYAQQQRLDYLKAVVFVFATEGTGTLFESAGARMLARDAVAAEGTVDALTGRMGGQIVEAGRLDRLQGILSRNNTTLVRNADAYLDSQGAGALFKSSDSGAQLFIRSDVTQYELYHELKHFGDYNRLGFEAYRDLGSLGREESVFNYLKNQNWMTSEEINHAYRRIVRERGW